MQSITVSPKYQVVIPKTVRKALNIRPGQKMQVVEYAGRIELIPERDIKDTPGIPQGHQYGIQTGGRQGMNIVDSSGWLAYFADEPNAKHFLTPLSNPDLLVVPTVTIYEVFKVILRESTENEALQAVVAMQKGTVVDLNASLAIAASKLSLEHNLPMGELRYLWALGLKPPFLFNKRFLTN